MNPSSVVVLLEGESLASAWARMPDALSPILTRASARWRFTSTNLLEGDPGPNTCGEHGKKEHAIFFSWSYWLLWSWMTLQCCQQLGWADRAFIPLLGWHLGYRLSAEETRSWAKWLSSTCIPPSKSVSWELLLAAIASSIWRREYGGTAGRCSCTRYKE